jgi:hypothetical protein
MKSSNAFPAYARNIECTDIISSSLFGSGDSSLGAGGFFKWDRDISATITLPDRFHKAYAYILFLNILQERFKGMNVLGNGAGIPQGDVPPEQKVDVARKNWYILTKVKITNPIYTRQMKFDFSYLMVQSLRDIMIKSNILARVNTAYNPDGTELPLSEQWVRWDAAQDANVNGTFLYDHNNPTQFNSCTTEQLYPVFNHKMLIYATSTDDEYETQPLPAEAAYKLPKEDSYHSYNNKYQIIEENNNIGINYLQPFSASASYYKAVKPVTRIIDGVSLPGYNADPTSESEAKQQTVVRGLAKYSIRMHGYALRAGYRIPFPAIKSVNGVAVSRTGTARYSQNQISVSDTIPIYLAMWSVDYNVDGNIYSNDIFQNVIGTGDPGYYT